jgi:uncharacterized protein involved in copper resistance
MTKPSVLALVSRPSKWGYAFVTKFDGKFAAYLGVSWGRAFGATRNFDIAENASRFSWIAGIRFWF